MDYEYTAFPIVYLESAMYSVCYILYIVCVQVCAVLVVLSRAILPTKT